MGVIPGVQGSAKDSMEPMWSLAPFCTFRDQCSRKKEERSDVDFTCVYKKPIGYLKLEFKQALVFCSLADVTTVETSRASCISGGQLWWGPHLWTVFVVVGPVNWLPP